MGDNKQNSHSKKINNMNPLEKEEEYRRINEELEARTAALVKEANTLLTSEASYLDAAYSEEIENELENLKINESSDAAVKIDKRNTTNIQKTSAKKRGSVGKPGSFTANKMALDEKVSFLSELHDRVHVVAEQFKDSDDNDIDLENSATSRAAGAVDDILPGPAADLGVDAQNRFLKAKLRVLQEECEKIANECSKKNEEINQLANRIKEVEEERNRLHRTNNVHQIQIEKYKKISEESKTKADRLESELHILKKELDSTKRNMDQQGSSQKTQTVRLNRALEEVDKLKSELAKTKQASRDTGEADRRRLDQLLAENKRLEKQKGELVAGFKKQMKLIDVLKRQRMHIEAAKMLQFAEEDFVKALDWAN